MAAFLLLIAAVLEVATGVAVLVAPGWVGWLLLGAELVGPAIAVARLTGIALLALGLGCAFASRHSGKTAILAAVLVYNALAAVYLALLGVNGEFVGVLLWPAVAIHAVLAVLLARTWFGYRPADRVHDA